MQELNNVENQTKERETNNGTNPKMRISRTDPPHVYSNLVLLSD